MTARRFFSLPVVHLIKYVVPVSALYLAENYISMALIFSTLVIVYMTVKLQKEIIFDSGLLVSCVFFFYCAFSYIWSIDRDAGLHKIAMLSPFIILPILNNLLKNIDKHKILLSFYYVSFAVSFTLNINVLVNLLFGECLSSLTYIGYSSFFEIHPLYLSINFLVALVFGLKLSRELRYSFMSNLCLVLSIFFTQSKLSLFFVIIALMFFIANIIKNKELFYKFSGFLILIVVGVFLFYYRELFFYRIYEMTDLYDIKYSIRNLLDIRKIKDIQIPGTESTGIRITMYSTFMVNLDNLQPLGFGIGSYNEFFSQYCMNFRNGYYCKLYEGINAHNQYIQYFVELGTFGCLFFFALILERLYRILKSFNFIDIYLFFIICASLIFESMFERQRGTTLIAFVLFVLVNRNKGALK